MPLDDVTTLALTSALRGLSVRQRVTADNIANLQTPGFKAGRVDFESALRGAVGRGGTPDVRATVGRSLEPTRLDGNNVNLDEESVASVETGMRYQLAVQAMTAKLALLRTAIRG